MRNFISCNLAKLGSDIPSMPATPPSAPSLVASHIPYYHSLMCEWPMAIPLSSMWLVLIIPQSPTYLLSRLASIGNLEVHGTSNSGNSWQISQGLNEVWTDSKQTVIGCAFAGGIETPGDEMGIDFAGIQNNNRGFINGPIASHRSSLPPLQVSFIETNTSFTDTFIRPWSILAMHKGLFAYSPQRSIKSTIHVLHLAKAGSERDAVIRKRLSFYDAVPFSVPGEDYTYSESTSAEYRNCLFTYNSYTVSDGTDVT